MNLSTKVLLLVLLVTTAGCRPCLKPDLCLPDCFTEAQDCTSEEDRLDNWWKQFNDPLLDDFIAKALNYNQNLLVAYERICEARATYRIELGKPLPQIDGNTNFSRYRNSETLTDSAFLGGKFVNFFRAGFDASWEWDIFGKKQDEIRAAALDINWYHENARDIQISLISEVADTYLSILTLQERVNIAEKHIDNESHMLKVVESRYDAGFARGIDVETAKTLLYEREANLPSLQSQLRQEIYALGVLLGQTPETIVYLFQKQRPLPSGDNRIPSLLPGELLCRRPDIKAAEYAMKASGARVLASRKELLPTISLTGFYTYASGFARPWFWPESRFWNIAPGGSIPLFRGGEIWANIDVQTSRQRQSVLEYEKTVLSALKDVESAFVSYFKEKEKLSALRKKHEASKEARDLADTLYVAGVVDYLYVNIIERDHFFTENALAESQKQEITKLISIYKALGGGWECSDSP